LKNIFPLNPIPNAATQRQWKIIYKTLKLLIS
jgi:hypothetical protein